MKPPKSHMMPKGMMPKSHMPKGSKQSPSGDIGAQRQAEAATMKGFKGAATTVKASSRFKGMGDVMSKM